MKRGVILQNLFAQRKRFGDCKKAKLIFSALLLLATTSCTGCSLFQNFDYGYKRPFNFEDPKMLKHDYTNGQDFRKGYDDYMKAENWFGAKQERDQILGELMYAIDGAYGQFERNSRVGKGTFDLASDVLVLGFNAAGAVTGTEQFKSIMNAVSGGIMGTQSAVNKRLLAEQAIEAIQAQMHANMKLCKADIVEKMMNKSVLYYTLEMGLSDIVNYYYAGTFTRALQSLAKSAKDTEDTADKTIQGIMMGTAVSWRSTNSILKIEPK